MPKTICAKTEKNLANNLEDAISAFYAFCDSKNLSERTIEYYRCRLVSFTRYLAETGIELKPVEATPAVIRDFLSYEKAATSPATANHSLCTLKAFFSFLRDDGVISTNPAASIQKLRVRKPIVETFSREQMESILRTCRKDFYGVRDKAIILLLLDTGMRAGELCGIRLEDVNWNQQTIRLLGKGDKERVVPFGDHAKDCLRRYMTARGDLETTALFVGHYGDPIDRTRLRDIVKKRCKKAGIKGIRPSPHTRRHTCAVWYLRNGGDTFTLQRLLGHTSQDMTRRYCETLNSEDVQKKHTSYSPADNIPELDAPRKRKRLK